jgi:hypothetical protein
VGSSHRSPFRWDRTAHLALRDDPRGDDGLDALGYPDEDSPYYWLLDDVFRHRRLVRHDPADDI